VEGGSCTVYRPGRRKEFRRHELSFLSKPIAMLFYRMGTFAPAHGRRYFSLLTMRPLCASTQTVLVLFV
jgi:hypothetical protein